MLPVCVVFSCRFSAAGYNSVRRRETDATARSVSVRPVLAQPYFIRSSMNTAFATQSTMQIGITLRSHHVVIIIIV